MDSTEQQRSTGRLLFLIAKDLRTAMDRDLAPFGLRAQQAAVLVFSCHTPGASPRYLADAVGTDTAGITGLLDHLEKQGLVRRQPNASDRRAVIVEPTGAGLELLPQIVQVLHDCQGSLLDGFSPDETNILDEMLSRVHGNLIRQLSDAGNGPGRRR